MATKWKNRLAFLVFALLMAFGLRGIYTGLDLADQYLINDYFQTQQFEEQLKQFVDYLTLFELSYQSPEAMKERITVTQEEIEEHRYRYGDLTDQIASIRAQYEEKIEQAKEIDDLELAEVYRAERDRKIDDITQNFLSDDHVRAKILREKEENIDRYHRELEELRPYFTRLAQDFQYYLRDTATGEVFTNLPVKTQEYAESVFTDKNMLTLRTYPTVNKGYLTTDPDVIYAYFANVMPVELGQRSLAGKIGVPKTASLAGPVMLDYQNYQHQRMLYWVWVGSSLVAIALGVYLSRKWPVAQWVGSENWQGYYNRIPLDLGLAGFSITGLITLSLLTQRFSLYYGNYERIFSDLIPSLLIAALFFAVTLIQGRLLLGRVKDWSALKAEWQQGMLFKTYQSIKEAFLIRGMGTQVLVILAIAFGCGAGAVFTLLAPRLILLYGPFFLLVGVPVIIGTLRWVGFFNRIVACTDQLVRGEYGQDLPVKGKGPLVTLAANINELKQGFQTSQLEQAKSQRLKTELITNVSHDLRTPLTSIISYTELLKKPDLAEEERTAYIQIIDRKAKRLKVLIDDLFEASKMASGNIELVKERVDLVQLLQQALAEHNEAIQNSSLQFRVTKPEHPVYAMVDGQKMWRVFDNLISNILKYSLENTRVYISLQVQGNKAVLVFKNISKYELAEDVDELLERFKRGDTSRHTEGSGLGLAIAKSIVDLHGDTLDIELDGDLFKITVKLALA